MEFERRDDVSEAEYMEMIRLKTSVLLAGSLHIGALLGGAPGARRGPASTTLASTRALLSS